MPWCELQMALGLGVTDTRLYLQPLWKDELASRLGMHRSLTAALPC